MVWAVLAAPAMAVEIVAVYSLVTGYVSTPPWTGAGLIAVLSVAGAGFASLVIGWRMLADWGGPPV